MEKNKKYRLNIPNLEDEDIPFYDPKKFKKHNKSRPFKIYINFNYLITIIIIFIFAAFFLFLFINRFSNKHSQKLISLNENFKEQSSQINNISNITKNYTKNNNASVAVTNINKPDKEKEDKEKEEKKEDKEKEEKEREEKEEKEEKNEDKMEEKRKNPPTEFPIMHYNSKHANEILTYNSSTTFLIIGIAKLENRYVREWVEHYHKLGTTKIILCDDNTKDGERLAEPIQDYVDSNFVTIDESYRGVINCQMSCYSKHYYENQNKYDWISLLDLDEFIYLEEGSGYTKIQHFLDEPIFNDTDNIILTWKHYDDNDILDATNGNYSLKSRFTRHVLHGVGGDPNSLSKAIYKGKVDRNYRIGNHCIQGFSDQHGRNYIFRITNGKIMHFKGIGWCFYNFNNTHFPVSIHHFSLKSVGEYIDCKMKRSAVNIDRTKNTFKRFFDENRLTKEKIDYILQKLNPDQLKTFKSELEGYMQKLNYSNPTAFQKKNSNNTNA